MAVPCTPLWRRLASMNVPSPLGGPVPGAMDRLSRSAWSNNHGTWGRSKPMRSVEETGGHRVDGTGHDGHDARVAGRRGQRAAGHALDPTADRAGETLCDPSPPVDLYRWFGVVYPGHAGDLARSRAHGARRTAPAALVAQHLARPSGQALRAQPGGRHGTPHCRWDASTCGDTP